MDPFVGLPDLRQAKKASRDLLEMLVVAVCAVLAGAGNFVEIEEWAKENLDCFRQYLRQGNGILSYDTLGRVFATIDTMGAQHWRVENCLRWCMDVAFGDGQLRSRTCHSAHAHAIST